MKTTTSEGFQYLKLSFHGYKVGIYPYSDDLVGGFILVELWDDDPS